MLYLISCVVRNICQQFQFDDNSHSDLKDNCMWPWWFTKNNFEWFADLTIWLKESEAFLQYGKCHPCVCGCTNKGVTLLAEAMICFCCKQSRPVVHRMSLASLKRNGFKRVIKGHSNLMGGSCFQHLYYSTCSNAVAKNHCN